MEVQVMNLDDCTVFPTHVHSKDVNFSHAPQFNVDAQMCLMTAFKKKRPFQSISVQRSGRYHYSDIEMGGESVDMLPVAMQRWLLFFSKKRPMRLLPAGS